MDVPRSNTLTGRLLRLLAATLGTALGALAPAQAAPTVNQDQGFWFDTFVDPAGITTDQFDPGTGLEPWSVGIRHSVGGQLVTLLDTATTGRYASPLVTPSSSRGWAKVYLDFTAYETADLVVKFADESNTLYGPFPLVASDDPAFDRMALLSVPASVTRGRLVVELSASEVTVSGTPTTVRPSLLAAKLTWLPASIVRVAYTSAKAEPCTNEAYVYTLQIAVSSVSAPRLIAWAPLPTAPADPFGAANAIQFLNATNGGYLTTSATTLAGVAIPANSVVFDLGYVRAGTTMRVSYSARIPSGVTDDTLYTGRAYAQARQDTSEFGALATSLDTVAKASSRPGLAISKRVLSAYMINNIPYVQPDTTATYEVRVGNFFGRGHEACTETYHAAVVWDDVSDLLGGNAGGPFIDVPPGITIAPSAYDSGFVATDTVIDGVLVEGPAVYWRVGHLTVGSQLALQYSVDLRPQAAIPEGSTADNVALVESAVDPESASTTHTLGIGYPRQPNGLFATGDGIRGSKSASAQNNDNSYLSVGYGESFGLLLSTRNAGASTLNRVISALKIPAGTTFESVYVPAEANATVYYSTAGAANQPTSPPDFDVATGTRLPGDWTTTPPPAADVVWVMVQVPAIASMFFPSGSTPTSVTAEVNVNVDLPTSGCPLLTLEGTGLYGAYAYTPQGETTPIDVPPVAAMVADLEPIQVKPEVPAFDYSSVSMSPASLVAAGSFDTTVLVRNQQTLGATTDAAGVTTVAITLPRLALNGVDTLLATTVLDSAGGTVDYTQAASGQLRVTFAYLEPGASRSIRLRTIVPPGYDVPASSTVSATVRAVDAECGPIERQIAGAIPLQGNPVLVSSKRADLAIAGPGTALTYTLELDNTGDVISHRTWLVDQIPTALTVTSATATANGGEVWFAPRGAAGLPANLDDADFAWSDAVVTGAFSLGQQAAGIWTPPAGMDVGWVAYLVDDTTLTPAGAPVDRPRSVELRATVAATATEGTVVRNRLAIFSNELLPALSNESLVTLSGDPSLALDSTCGGPYYPGEIFTVAFDYENNSTNDAYGTELAFTLPPFVELVAGVHTWNAEALSDPLFPAPAPEVTCTAAAGVVTCDVGAALGAVPLGSLQGGHLDLSLRVVAGTSGGTSGALLADASATDALAVRTVTTYASCELRVELADLTVDKSVDNPTPAPGQVVTFTLDVRNAGANAAAGVEVVDVLPAGLTVLPGAAVVTPGWTLGGSGAPHVSGQTLTWSVAHGNALTRVGGTPGLMEGGAGPVRIALQATVSAGVTLGATLTNQVTVQTTSPETTPGLTNSDTASVRVPYPDPWIDKSGPATATPRGTMSYFLRYGSASSTATSNLLVIDRLPDLRLLGVTVFAGETIYYNTASGAVAPAFDLANPAANGWTTTRPANATSIAVLRPTLPGNSGPFRVQVDLEVRRASGLPPLAGDLIDNCASVGYPTGRAIEDEVVTNNSSCTRAAVPGIDLAMDLTCDPDGAYPGVLPGAPLTLGVASTVTGTVTAYGVYVDWTPPAWLQDVVVDAVTVTPRDASGNPLPALDLFESPIPDAIPWTRVGNRFYVGSTDAASPLYYRKVGVSAGATFGFTATGTIDPTLTTGTPLSVSTTVGTDLRFDAGPTAATEENLTNNVDACGPTVQLPDPMVAKSTTTAGPLVAGQVVDYRVEFNNTGYSVAQDVVVDDVLPPGMPFVVGSATGLPAGATLQYDDGTGAYTYTPTGAAGTLDPNVTALRVVFAAGMDAPAAGGYVAERKADFDHGTYGGTSVSTDGEVLLVAGWTGVTSGTYTTEVFPPAGESVTEWIRVLLDATVTASSSLSVDVLDANGAVIRAGLAPDVSGAVDLRDIDPDAYPRIALRLNMAGGEVACTYEYDTSVVLQSAPAYPPETELVTALPDGTIAGNMNGLFEADNSNYTYRAAVWDGGTSATAPTELPTGMTTSGVESRVKWRWGDDLVGEVYNPTTGGWRDVVWRRVSGTWQLLDLAPGVGSLTLSTSDSSGGYLVGQADGALTVFRPDAAGYTAQTVADAARSCGPQDARDGLIVAICYGDSPAGNKASAFRLQPGGAFTEEPLPDAPLRFEHLRIMANGDLLGAEGSQDATSGWNVQTPHAWTHLGGTWTRVDLMPAGPNWASVMPSVGDRMAFYTSTLVLLSYPWGSYWTADIAVMKSYVVERVGNAWQANMLPFGPSGTWSQLWGIGADGVAFGRGGVGPNNFQDMLWTPQADGTFAASFVASAGNRYPTFTGGLATDLGGNPRKLELLDVPPGGPDGTLAVLELEGTSGWNLNMLQLYPYTRSWTDPAALPTTPYLGNSGPSPLVWVPQGTSPVAPQVLAPTADLTETGYIEVESHGAYLGYTGYNWDVPVIWRPEAGGGLKQYVLPEPPGYSYNDWIDIGMVSIDRDYVLGTYYPQDGMGESIVMYRFDETQDAYVVDRAPMTLGPEHAGYTNWPDDSSNQTTSPDAVWTYYYDADSNDIAGYLVTLPGVEGFVWTHDITYADGVSAPPWGVNHEPSYGKDGMTLFEISGTPATTVAVIPDPEGVRKAIAVLAPANFANNIWSIGYGRTIATKSPTGAPVIYKLVESPTPTFVELPIGDGTLRGTVFGLTEAPFPGTEYPLAVVEDDAEDYAIYAPDAAGTYTKVVVPIPSGYTAFMPYVGWAAPRSNDMPDVTGFEATGLVGGRLVGADGTTVPAVVGYRNGAWVTAPLPYTPVVAGGVVEVKFMTEGPVIYGSELLKGFDSTTAWYFPTGDLTAAASIRVGNTQFDTLSGYNGARPFVATASSADRGPIVMAKSRSNDYVGYGFFVPRKDAAGRIARVDYVNAPSLDNHVYPWMVDTMVGTSSPTIAWYDDNRPLQWGCYAGGGVGVDSLRAIYRGSVNPGFDYSLALPDTCQASVTNTATITSSTPQITTANDSASVELAVATVDLVTDLAVDRGTVVAGQTLTYTASVTNLGPSPAHDLVLTVVVPDVTDPAAEGTTYVYDLCADFAVCELAAGDTYTLPAITTAPSTLETAFDQLVATASITCSDITCNIEDDAASVTTLTGALPNVYVQKTGPAQAAVGQPITYTISYGNNGNADATNVQVVDTPPAGMTLVPSNAPTTWTAATLAPSPTPTTTTVTVAVDDCSLVGTRLTNTVAVTADFDVMDADNSASATTLLTAPTGALELVAYPGRSSVAPNGTLTYFVRYRNTGTAAVAGAVLYAQIPTGTTVIAGQSTPGMTVVGSEARWTLPTSLPAGATGGVELTVRATGSAGATLAGSARIDVGAPSVSNACDVSAAYSASSIEAPGLIVTKQASTATTCGGQVDWVITVANAGATTQTGLVVVDQVAAATAYVDNSIQGPGANDGAAPVLVWSVGTLAPGAAVTLGYRTAAPAQGVTVSNVALVQRAGATLTTSAPAVVVGACSALTLSKAMAATCSEVADSVEVTLAWSNGTGGALTGVTVVDPIQPGFTFVSADAPLTWNSATSTLTANLGAVAAGASGTLRYTVSIASVANGSVLADSATLASAEGVTAISNQVTTVVQTCDDGDPCTVDNCAAFAGCVHTLVPTPEVPELCDLVDNDCDRLVDADDPDLVPEPCELQDGVCAGTVTTECVAGDWLGCTTTDYVAQTDGQYDPADSGCDGVDNDCDGVIDDGFVGEVTPVCGTGVCATTSTFICDNGAIVNPCTPLSPLSTVDSECDGLDADCDGATDEEFQPQAVSCLAATCVGVGMGTATCAPGGQLMSTCDPAFALASSDPAYLPSGATDPSCAPMAVHVSYAVVYDRAGAPVGSIRCTRDVQTGAITCDVEEGTTTLDVLDGAYCPAP